MMTIVTTTADQPSNQEDVGVWSCGSAITVGVDVMRTSVTGEGVVVGVSVDVLVARCVGVTLCVGMALGGTVGDALGVATGVGMSVGIGVLSTYT